MISHDRGKTRIDHCLTDGLENMNQGELSLLIEQLGERIETDEDLVIEFLGETFHECAAVAAPSERRDP